MAANDDEHEHRDDDRGAALGDGLDDRTALLVVDVQNDFVDPAGALSVAGGEDVIEPLNEKISAAGAAGALVVYTQDWHPEHTPHFQRDGGIWPVHCVGGSWGAELHPRLVVVEAEVIRKGADGSDGYSAFGVRDPRTGATRPTPLEHVLREHGVERLVIGGLATDYCVLETVLDARRLGFEIDVLAEAIRAVDLEPGDGGRALRRMSDVGATIV